MLFLCKIRKHEGTNSEIIKKKRCYINHGLLCVYVLSISKIMVLFENLYYFVYVIFILYLYNLNIIFWLKIYCFSKHSATNSAFLSFPVFILFIFGRPCTKKYYFLGNTKRIYRVFMIYLILKISHHWNWIIINETYLKIKINKSTVFINHYSCTNLFYLCWSVT